jgi:hypothetical protein
MSKSNSSLFILKIHVNQSRDDDKELGQKVQHQCPLIPPVSYIDPAYRADHLHKTVPGRDAKHMQHHGAQDCDSTGVLDIPNVISHLNTVTKISGKVFLISTLCPNTDSTHSGVK